MLKRSLSILPLFIALGVSAQNKKIEAPINLHMHNISQNLHRLLPYLSSEDQFVAKENEKEVKNDLNGILNEFQKIKKHPNLTTPGFSLTRTQMVDNLKDVISSFETNHKPYARHKLNSTFGLCITCHTQLHKENSFKLFREDDIEKVVSEPFEKAEIYFITRDFKLALENYDRTINSYSAKTGDRKKLETALNRKLSYYTRIEKKQDEAAIKGFQANLSNSEIPKVVQEQVEAWIKELKTPYVVKDSMADYLKKISHENAEGPLASLFSNKEVNDLRISGYLYEYLHNHPKDTLVPEILYNLAIFDKRLNVNLFYSMGDLYLLECINNHAKSPFAKLCYKAYEEEKIFSYTGSSGTHLPLKLKKELEALKKKVK